jgi:hypothetical protein
MSSVMCISVEKMGVESIHFVAWSVGPEIVTVCMAKKLGTRNANDGTRTCQISPDGFGFCVASESGIMPFYDDAVIPNYACSAAVGLEAARINLKAVAESTVWIGYASGPKWVVMPNTQSFT